MGQYHILQISIKTSVSSAKSRKKLTVLICYTMYLVRLILYYERARSMKMLASGATP